jgi:hypothetical protein
MPSTSLGNTLCVPRMPQKSAQIYPNEASLCTLDQTAPKHGMGMQKFGNIVYRYWLPGVAQAMVSKDRLRIEIADWKRG